jgi:hypothetical protein
MKINLFLGRYLKLRLNAHFGVRQTVHAFISRTRRGQWNLNKPNSNTVQESLNKGEIIYEFTNWMEEVATLAFNNLEEMHRMDTLRREEIGKR